jgi:hypothetical protein
VVSYFEGAVTTFTQVPTSNFISLDSLQRQRPFQTRRSKSQDESDAGPEDNDGKELNFSLTKGRELSERSDRSESPDHAIIHFC